MCIWCEIPSSCKQPGEKRGKGARHSRDAGAAEAGTASTSLLGWVPLLTSWRCSSSPRMWVWQQGLPGCHRSQHRCRDVGGADLFGDGLPAAFCWDGDGHKGRECQLSWGDVVRLHLQTVKISQRWLVSVTVSETVPWATELPDPRLLLQFLLRLSSLSFRLQSNVSTGVMGKGRDLCLQSSSAAPADPTAPGQSHHHFPTRGNKQTTHSTSGS